MVEAKALQTMKDGKLERCCGFELDVKRFLHTWLASQRALLPTKTYDLKTWLFSVLIKRKPLKTILYDFWPKWGQKLDFCKWKIAWPLSHMTSIFVSAVTDACHIYSKCVSGINKQHKLMLEKTRRKTHKVPGSLPLSCRFRFLCSSPRRVFSGKERGFISRISSG